MRSRFVTGALLLVVGVLLAVVRWLFTAPAMPWLVFGLAALTFAVVLGVFPLRGRGRGQRWLDAATALVSGWLAVFALLYGAQTVGWLAVGGGAAVAILAAGGLAAHEQRMEQAAHEYAALMIGDGRRDGDGGSGLVRPRADGTAQRSGAVS